MSASSAACGFSMPRMRASPSSAFSSDATFSARSRVREPMITSSPAMAQRNASPGPCCPVPPRIAIVIVSHALYTQTQIRFAIEQSFSGARTSCAAVPSPGVYE